MALLLKRHHQKEKQYGPGPSNNYTSGRGKTPFWKRNKKGNRDAEELGALGAGSAAIADEKHKKNKRVSDIRPSHETGMTGSTAAAPDAAYGGSSNKYAEPAVPTHHNANTGYPQYSQQQTGTAVTAPDNTYGSGYGGDSAGYGQPAGTKVFHDPNPYAEVHGDGHPHSRPEADGY